MAYDSYYYNDPFYAVQRKWGLGCGRCQFNIGQCAKNVTLYPKMGREDCTYWKPKKKPR